MEIKIPIKKTYRATQIVEDKHTAIEYGSGLAKVFATPAMIALMENASYKCIEEFLPEGYSSVGTEICVQHLRATLPGDSIYADSTVVSVDGRKISFEVEAFDSKGLIGTGKHDRFMVETKKFLAKLNG